MGDTFNGVFYRMSKVIHRVDAPLVTGIVMRRMSYTIDNRIPHIDVRGRHIDFGTENLFPVGILALLHCLEKLKILLSASAPVRAFPAGFFKSSSVFFDFLRCQVAYISFSFLNELHCCFVHLIKIIRCPQPLIPLETKPSNILFDRTYIFHVLLDRICVIIS